MKRQNIVKDKARQLASVVQIPEKTPCNLQNIVNKVSK